MAGAELDSAIAREDWDGLVAAIEADDDPAAAAQRAEPAIAHWPDERRELPAELWRELAAGAEPPPWLPLTRHLRLERGDELDGAARTPWLTSLDLLDYDGFFEPLRELPGLRSLAIGPAAIDAASLGALTRLETLRLHQPQYWVPLDELELSPTLRVLDIRHSELATLDGLARVPGLQRLELVDNKLLSDVSALAALPALEWLSLAGCTGLTDLSVERVVHLPPLDRLQALRDLSLGGDELAGLGPLSALPALERLQLDGLPRIDDLAPLGALASLHTLTLTALPRVDDLAPLGALASLRTLGLRGLPLATDVAPLGKLARLESLHLTYLEALVTYCPGVADIAPLAAARALQFITLRDLGVRDVSPLAALPRLQQIGIAQTPPPAGLDAFDARRTRVYNPSQL
jgi:hypothetical protein